jgi:hypothetical protein
MSGKKNKVDIERRRRDVSKEIELRQSEKVENVVNEIAERLYLRPSSIWRDLRLHKENGERN